MAKRTTDASISRREFLREALFGAALVGAAFLPWSSAAARPRVSKGLPLPNPPGPVLVLAPHPDDEVLGAGVRWHVLLHEGRRVDVVVVTMGDGFRVDAERLFQTFRPTPTDYRQLGLMRRQESLRATSLLGLPPERLHFLGLPDGGTGELFVDFWDRTYRDARTATDRDPYPGTLFPGLAYRGREEFRALKAILEKLRPTTVILPHPYDQHPDHWATHAFALSAMEALRLEGAAFARQAVHLLYLVHWQDWPVPLGYAPDAPLLPPAALASVPTVWFPWHCSPALRELKHEAILQYKSQMAVMPEKLLAFVRQDELFGIDAPILVPFWHGRWGGVPVEVATAQPVFLQLFLPNAPQPARLQLALGEEELLLHLLPSERTEVLRLDLYLTLVHPRFPDGVLRLVLRGAGGWLTAELEGHGPLGRTALRRLKDGSLVLTVPHRWLRGATSFLLGGGFLPAGLPPAHLPYRLFRLRAAHGGLFS